MVRGETLFEEELGQNKVLFGSQHGQMTNGQTATTGFSTLSALERQISNLLLVSGSTENQTNSILLYHLT